MIILNTRSVEYRGKKNECNCRNIPFVYISLPVFCLSKKKNIFILLREFPQEAIQGDI